MKPDRFYWISIVLVLTLVIITGCQVSEDDDSDSISWTVLGSDDFNRADNTYTTANKDNMLGEDWDCFADENDNPHSMIEITSNKVEIRGDSGADYETPLNDTIVKLYIEWTTADIASLDVSNSNSFGFYDEQYNINQDGCPYTAGVIVDTSEASYVTYLIEMDNSTQGYTALTTETVNLDPNTTYQFVFVVNEGSLSFSLKNNAGEAISTITAEGDSCIFTQPGFSMQYTDDISFFVDNFEAYTGESD